MYMCDRKEKGIFGLMQSSKNAILQVSLASTLLTTREKLVSSYSLASLSLSEVTLAFGDLLAALPCICSLVQQTWKFVEPVCSVMS